jgi:hypothetical protein
MPPHSISGTRFEPERAYSAVFALQSMMLLIFVERRVQPAPKYIRPIFSNA